MQFFIKVFQGTLIGLGAVLPGISGGVLCVIFGIYRPVMELLAEPFRNFKTHVPKLFPVILGGAIGFLGIANVLAVMLERYPAPSVCLFIGLIAGMFPALIREAGQQGVTTASYVSMYVAMIAVFALLIGLKIFSVEITPSFGWYVFCGVCLALSVIAPGMSFSTLLMPLGLYEPFVAGIGGLDMAVLVPGGIGGVATVVLFSKAVNVLFTKHYSVAFHGIVGIVLAATIMIVPFESFVESPRNLVLNCLCLFLGVWFARRLDRVNQMFEAQVAE
ncbi:MAG: DUF368 domain-containing protein [Lachnospiraceae bacterium]|nr:DUF368 domain-containing protein [Lachnospiraceae bacterium]